MIGGELDLPGGIVKRQTTDILHYLAMFPFQFFIRSFISVMLNMP